MNSVYAKGELVSARFQIRELIGAGDLGQVFEVWDLSTASLAALKQFTTPAARIESAASAVERAARVGPQSSPIFIKAQHVGATDHGLYVVQERLGPSLEKRRLPPAEVASAFEPVAAGLDRAHASGLVHGDLHPRNVFPVSPQIVRVTDFGVWPLRAAAPNPWPALPGWTAPELVQGAPASPRSDLYAFAQLLFYAVAGVPLFRSLSTGRVDVNALWTEMNAGIDVLVRAHELGASLNPNAAIMLSQALSPDPNKRPGTCATLVAGLAGNKTGANIAVGTLLMVSPLEGLPAEPARPTPAPGRPPSEPPPQRQSRPHVPSTSYMQAVPPMTPVPPSPPAQAYTAPPRPSSQPPTAPVAPGGFAPVPSNPPPRFSPSERAPAAAAQPPRAQRNYSTIVADSSVLAFPDLHGAPASPSPAPAAGQPAHPAPAPPPLMRQLNSPEPLPPALVDARAPEPEGTTRRDFTATSYALAAREEWAQVTNYPVGPIGPESLNGDLRAVIGQDKQRIKPTTIALLIGGLTIVVALLVLLLYLLLRMDDAAKFPQPKSNLDERAPAFARLFD